MLHVAIYCGDHDEICFGNLIEQQVAVYSIQTTTNRGFFGYANKLHLKWSFGILAFEKLVYLREQLTGPFNATKDGTLRNEDRDCLHTPKLKKVCVGINPVQWRDCTSCPVVLKGNFVW
jgi:hypothetical protein